MFETGVFVDVCFQRQVRDCQYWPCSPKFSVHSLFDYEVIQLLSQTCMTWNVILLYSFHCYVSMIVMWFGNALGPRGLNAYCDWIHKGAPESNLELDTSQRDNLADAMPLKAAMVKSKRDKGSDSNFMTFWFKLLFMIHYEDLWGVPSEKKRNWGKLQLKFAVMLHLLDVLGRDFTYHDTYIYNWYRLYKYMSIFICTSCKLIQLEVSMSISMS